MATVTLSEYISVSDIKERASRIDSILTALETAMIDGGVDVGRSGYSFDDGQTKVQTTFRNLSDITTAYNHWFRVKNLLLMQLEGGGIFTAREMNL